MPTIVADGLCFRPFEERDAAPFAQAARESARSVGPWMPWCHAEYSDRDAHDWFATCNQGLREETAFEFGVFSETGGEFLGGAGLNQVNKQHAFCNLGYWVRQSRQGQAIASRCVRVLAHFGFEFLKLNRVEIVVAVGNLGSEAVARNSGALLECVARNRLVIRGAPVAASVFSLIPSPVNLEAISDVAPRNTPA